MTDTRTPVSCPIDPAFTRTIATAMTVFTDFVDTHPSHDRLDTSEGTTTLSVLRELPEVDHE
jgi:hypothetical protein